MSGATVIWVHHSVYLLPIFHSDMYNYIQGTRLYVKGYLTVWVTYMHVYILPLVHWNIPFCRHSNDQHISVHLGIHNMNKLLVQYQCGTETVKINHWLKNCEKNIFSYELTGLPHSISSDQCLSLMIHTVCRLLHTWELIIMTIEGSGQESPRFVKASRMVHRVIFGTTIHNHTQN